MKFDFSLKKILMVFFALSLGVGPLFSSVVLAEAEDLPANPDETTETTATDEDPVLVPNDIEFPYNTTVVRSRDYLNFDNKLSEYILDDYREVKEIHVVYITAPTSDIQSDGDEWVKGLFYYLITKESFPDVPFNFVVTHDGLAYSGKYGASDVQPFAATEKNDKGKLLVAYMGLSDNFDIEYAGEQKLKDLLGYLTAYYKLDDSAIIPSNWSIQKSADLSTASEIALTQIPRSSRWASQVYDIVDAGLPNYSTFNRTYSTKQGDLIFDKEAEIGGRIKVVVEYTNNGKFPWYKNSSDQLILYVKGKAKSDYFVNKVWLSQEAVGTINTDWVLPGQSGQFSFELAVPFVADTYTEDFELGTLNGQTIKGSEIKIEFKAIGGTKSLVEILPTGYDYLNVRDKASSFGKVIGTVTPGKKYLLVQETEGFYKIRLNDGTEGWVTRKYAKVTK
jgi:hypothetical protein